MFVAVVTGTRDFIPIDFSSETMSTLATSRTDKIRPHGRSEQFEKRSTRNLDWEQISRPMPCYFVMILISIFETLLAILLLPYNLLNRTD